MDITEFLDRLDGVAGGNNQYSARCPAHDDRTASLAVSTGQDGKILLHCHAGCTTPDILAAIGLEPKDLFPPKEPARRRGKRKQEAEYLYYDMQGNPILKKIKYRYEDGSKGYQWFHRDKGEWKDKQAGIVPPLYRQNAIAAAGDQPIYVVEGEKDADTLAGCGMIAVSAPNGAGGKTKWLDAYTEALRGRDLVILQDNDEPGKAFAEATAQAVIHAAERVRLVDLAAIWPDIPPKADITDYIDHLSDKAEALKRFVALVESTPAFAPPEPAADADRFHGTGYEATEKGFFRVYQKDGQTVRQFLGNFYILADSETVRDNGADIERVFSLRAVCDNHALLAADISAQDFQSMNFLSKTWGLSLRPAIGQNVLSYYRDSISAQAGSVRNEYIYTHTGWRHIGGKWMFLHASGAVGGEGVRVELDGKLNRYSLPAAGNPLAVMDMFRLAPKEIIYPLVGLVFLSPLNEFFRRAGCEPSFVLYLLGITGAMKSTLAAMALSFFGTFDNKSLPSSFKDTANSLEKQGFLLKDVLTVVDDYHPTGSRQEATRMAANAQNVARMYGDRTARNRMNADGSLRGGYIPRGNVIVTGEDLPNIGQSGTARNLVVEVRKGDIDKKVLTDLQGRTDDLSGCMRAYIEWLLPQADTLPDILKSRFIQLRLNASQDDRHGRIAETIAHLQIGMDMLILFLVEAGNTDKGTAERVASDCWDVLLKLAEQQNERLEQDKPTVMFINAIQEMLETSQVIVEDIDREYIGCHPVGFVGWQDSCYFYLFAETAYRMVVEFYARQGRNFPISKAQLLKMLAAEGWTLTDPASGKNTRPKRINGKLHWLLCIPRERLELQEAS